ncbi:MAG: sodium:proton antiporter [Pirellulaceae bacterium]
MEHVSPLRNSHTLVVAVIGLLVAGYVASLMVGLPQRATAAVVGHSAESFHGQAAEETRPATAHEPLHSPPIAMILPFVLLLGAIALLPLIPNIAHWWEHNLNKFSVASTLAVLTLSYYLFFHEWEIAGHFPAHHTVLPDATGPNAATAAAVLANAVLAEFVPFIVLLFSLYTISGGIRLEGDLPARSLINTTFLAVGGLLASIVGTTGAAMLLIRPLLETNRERKHVKHTVVFFIFVVCNCGGLLLPTGDPPLFLGYLLGVPFLFTLGLWQPWLFVNVSLLVIYFLWDHFLCYPRETKSDILRDEAEVRPLRIRGLWPNAWLLAGVVATVGLLDPSKAVLGTTWHPWMYLRELVQLVMVGLSLVLGERRVRQANGFNYGAILEVAVLFFGIFVCMQPPLQILEISGPRLGLTQPSQFFWATGILSSFLDNAPTYVVFFETAKSVTASQSLSPTVAGTGVYLPYLIAISLGAVFMGANTYIGNGPNFMVKTIAESSGIQMPSFFGYMLYSICILIPLFVLTGMLFT